MSGFQGDLLNPCRCDGSVRHTHQNCLLKWISERGCWTCELCCYRFQVVAINMKRPWQVRRRWSRDHAGGGTGNPSYM